jgi:hypothetical protein
LILFPVGILIWARGEMRRRMSMPPEELAKLEADEDYGPIDEKLECIFCHAGNCVRTQKITYYTGDPRNILSQENFPRSTWRTGINPAAIPVMMTATEMSKHEHYIQAHCMKCGNTWEMFLPEEAKN